MLSFFSSPFYFFSYPLLSASVADHLDPPLIARILGNQEVHNSGIKWMILHESHDFFR